ncbi:glycoside hydrolase family 97 catalytic domain-containing protein [Micromonospora yasonensis]|uniref:glycoside hydrolase family 97 catalytic domain-containing protein n=1 Tax=Micromonospora yasonensis TaxID=1128667 RepID=UPI0022307550|nr:glycoside hydrolase family 97 catalytic domain-containing protein [Micromonospora yasonensis]MCW3839569.1 glycoside hydrolase family 97 catalytic domain-containing protein [Micromonospora yasonensis]
MQLVVSPRTFPVVYALSLLVAAAVMPTAPAQAAGEPATWVVTGPSASAPASARVSLDANGALAFAATYQGETVLAPAQIGLETTSANLTRDLEFLGRTDRVVNENYVMTTGKQRERRARFQESTLSFSGPGGARMDLVVRVSDDGVAYRYVLPTAGSVTVKREASSFSLPTGASAWLQPYVTYYETRPVETTAGAAATGDFGFPALFDVDGAYVLLTESDVDGRYSGGRLTHQAGSGTYAIKLADAQVTSAGPLATPWRTAIVGDLATVTASTLVDDLAPPARITDTSWIRPGAVAWSWLSEHSSPRDPARQRQYIDFAARNGWSYVLIDEGWNRSWVPELVRYARARGVEVLLWFHWNNLDTAQERDTTLPLIKSWGVAGVKIDFMESDSQARFKWYDDVLAKSAELKLMVNFHGATIPRGIQRTWPHVMSMEAVHGLEYLTLNPPDTTRAVLNTTLPFTRNVVGSMDTTPTIFGITDLDTTDAHELATFLVFESGWQHGADKPENYEMQPEALRMLNQLPTAWDETRLLSGRPGKEVVLARRAGDRWYLGAISAVSAKTFQTPLSFLPDGQWRVETLRDGANGLIRETQIVSAKDTLAVPVATNGGFVAAICRYRADTSTCDQPVRQVPQTSLTVTPTETDAQPGGAIDVSGTFTLSADGPITDVELRVMPPSGWQVDGATVSKPYMRDGWSIEGQWTVTPPEQVGYGYVDLPVVATYRVPQDPADRPVHVEQVVRLFVPPPTPSGTAYLSDLPFLSVSNGWGPVERDKSNGENGATDGATLTIDGKTYAKGLGAHATSEITIWLGRACRTLHAEVGIDDETAQRGSVVYQVLGDGRRIADTGVVRGTDSARPIDVDVTGVRILTLRVTDGGDGNAFDHADWADARMVCG